MTRKERYATDPEYRERIKAKSRQKSKARYAKLKQDAPDRLQARLDAATARRRAASPEAKLARDERRFITRQLAPKKPAKKRVRLRVRESRTAEWAAANRLWVQAGRKERGQELKQEAMGAYGGTCAACGIADLQVLTLDHVLEDGSLDRAIANSCGSALYRRLAKAGFPERDRYQVLCFNHNFKKHLHASDKSSRDIKLRAISAYSKNGCCASCGECDAEVLTIDHVKNNGGAHRKELGNSSLFYWLARNDYPPGYQVLCFNCNIKKSRKRADFTPFLASFGERQYNFSVSTAVNVGDFLKKFHYLGPGRTGTTFIVSCGQEIAACAIFSPPLRQNTGDAFGHVGYLELSRFCIHPNHQEKNFASWVLSRCLRAVKTPVVTYADATVGHTGILYKACNFTFHHEVAPDYWYEGNGLKLHKRTLYGRAVRADITERAYAEQFGYNKVFGGPKACFTYGFPLHQRVLIVN